MQNNPVTTAIDDPLFHRLANHVIATNRSLVVSVGTRKVRISPYHDEEVDETEFWAMLDELRAETAHRSAEEQQRLADEMDDAILAERNRKRQQSRTSS